MPIALYPGTFDPVTNGHVDIATRAASIFPEVIAVVADNPSKNFLFTGDERLKMATEALSHLKNVKVIKYSGLTVNCLEEHNATVLIRGLRALSDFDYEFQMAFMNRHLNAKAETVFLMPNEKFTYLSSTMVRQIASLKGSVEGFVPDHVKKMLEIKFSS